LAQLLPIPSLFAEISDTLPYDPHEALRFLHRLADDISQESAKDGWWEAIVIDRKADGLTLRFRDYPDLPKFVRHRSAIALMYRATEGRRPAVDAQQA